MQDAKLEGDAPGARWRRECASSNASVGNGTDNGGSTSAAAQPALLDAALQRQRQPLTFAEKNAVRRHHAAHGSGGSGGAAKHTDLVEWISATFGKKVGRSSIGRILNSALDVEEAAMGPQRMRKRFSKYPDVEASLLSFVLAHCERAAQLTDDVLFDHAKAVAGDRQVSMSWIQRFKRRNGIQANRRALLTSSDTSSDAARDAFIAALTKNRDELMQSITAAVSTTAASTAAPATASASNSAMVVISSESQQQRRNMVDADGVERARESDNAGEQSYEHTESDAVAPTPAPLASLTPVRRRRKASVIAPISSSSSPSSSSLSSATTTPSVRTATNPRFAIVSDTTGRVELESSSPLSTAAAAVAPARVAAASSASESSFLMLAHSSATAAAAAATATSPSQSPPDARSNHTKRRTRLPSDTTAVNANDQQQLEDERKRKSELEEHEIAQRVEGLRCDNVLKRIKIAEESMLARKRLRDAGVSDAEIDAMLPIVQLSSLSSS